MEQTTEKPPEQVDNQSKVEDRIDSPSVDSRTDASKKLFEDVVFQKADTQKSAEKSDQKPSLSAKVAADGLAFTDIYKEVSKNSSKQAIADTKKDKTETTETTEKTEKTEKTETPEKPEKPEEEKKPIEYHSQKTLEQYLDAQLDVPSRDLQGEKEPLKPETKELLKKLEKALIDPKADTIKILADALKENPNLDLWKRLVKEIKQDIAQWSIDLVVDRQGKPVLHMEPTSYPKVAPGLEIDSDGKLRSFTKNYNGDRQYKEISKEDAQSIMQTHVEGRRQMVEFAYSSAKLSYQFDHFFHNLGMSLGLVKFSMADIVNNRNENRDKPSPPPRRRIPIQDIFDILVLGGR